MLRALAWFFIGGLVLAGCTSNKLIRTQASSETGACDFGAASVSEDCRKYSIEDHKDYLLSVVEFDDQGWFRDREQQERLFNKLEEIGKQQDMIIVTFVHGWKHNADFCDSNMCCFRDMLQQVSSLEAQYSTQTRQPMRRVVGVYVGWRGLSMQGLDVWENLSFYTRKEAATRVALGSTRELLTRLRDFQTHINGAPAGVVKSAKDPDGAKATRPGTRLITVGHSFGGLVVYSAIAQSLVVNALDDGGDPANTYVNGFGDLVVLVNPAFEGSRYEPVYSVMQARSQYPTRQTPVFVAVTSVDDDATRIAFPLGRTFGSLLESYSGSKTPSQSPYSYTEADEKQADRRTIGHVDRYRTHSLVPDPNSKRAAVPKEVQPCSCPYAENIKKIGEVELKTERAERNKQFCEWLHLYGRRPNQWVRQYSDGVVLKHEQGYPDSPYWIVRTQTPIISDHNEFYTPLFMGFLRELYDDVLSRETFDLRMCKVPSPGA